MAKKAEKSRKTKKTASPKKAVKFKKAVPKKKIAPKKNKKLEVNNPALDANNPLPGDPFEF
jgi:hypothetical protein